MTRRGPGGRDLTRRTGQSPNPGARKWRQEVAVSDGYSDSRIGMCMALKGSPDAFLQNHAGNEEKRTVTDGPLRVEERLMKPLLSLLALGT